jgi:hypothetical protein
VSKGKDRETDVGGSSGGNGASLTGEKPIGRDDKIKRDGQYNDTSSWRPAASGNHYF